MKKEYYRRLNFVTTEFVNKAFLLQNITKFTDVHPVKLSDEWLKRASFVRKDQKFKHSFVKQLSREVFFIIYPPGFIDQSQKDYIWFYGEDKYISIKYVHTLQNLFFAIYDDEIFKTYRHEKTGRNCFEINHYHTKHFMFDDGTTIEIDDTGQHSFRAVEDGTFEIDL